MFHLLVCCLNFFPKSHSKSQGYYQNNTSHNQQYLCKELLKKIVDNGQNYTEKMKSDLKEIIDLGKSPEEICEATLAYFAMCRWQ